MIILDKFFQFAAKAINRPAVAVKPPPPPPPLPPPLPPPSEKELAHARWLVDDGDKTLRLDYDLSPTDAVVDLGGYEGQWASDIFSKYLCKVYVIEPVQKYADSISARFNKNHHISVSQCALGARSGELRISISGDASSSFKASDLSDTVQVIDFDSWMTELGIDEIALIKINIEGGEYELLDYLIETGLTRKIRNIQVQFHDFVPESDKRMLRIQEGLSNTHKLTYQYTYTWENWLRKE